MILKKFYIICANIKSCLHDKYGLFSDQRLLNLRAYSEEVSPEKIKEETWRIKL